MIPLPVGYKVHTPLLSRLAELVQQRLFYDRPKLGWVTRNGGDLQYLNRLLAIAPAYGVTTLIVDGDLSGEAADRIGASKLECEIFDPEKARATVLDATADDFGRGGLPYLHFDSLLARSQEAVDVGRPIWVRIDQPGRWGETLATWPNVYAISTFWLTGETASETILADYCRHCFGPPTEELVRMFALARKAVEKSFLVLDCLPLMNGSRWPENLAWLDRQVASCLEPDHPLSRPVFRTITDIDFEKIEAMECAHDAWKILETLSPQLSVNGFLWLEHYFLHLKVLGTALRILARGYFRLRARNVGAMRIPDHILRATYKDLYDVVCDHRAILTEFDTKAEIEGADPLEGVMADWRKLAMKK